MTHTNDFKAFAAGGGANVLDQAAFEALTTLIANGFTGGIAQATQLNKVWRQASVVSSMIGSFINDQGYDALDDGDLATLLAHFEAALVALNASSAPKLMVYCGTSTGSGNVQVLTPSPAIAAYGTGVPSYIFIAGYTNTGATTINISGLGPVAIYHDTESGPVALTGGEILAGSMCLLRYDGTHMRLEDSQLGTAALCNASIGTPGSVVAAVTSPANDHLVKFADANGTVTDGGAAGQAANKDVTDNTKTKVASVTGAFTVGHIATFADTAGTVQDGGAAPTIGTAGAKNLGHTIVDPGTGALEIAAPFVGGASATTGNTRTFVATDRGEFVRRSNSGTAMTDTLPGTSPGVLAAGWWSTIINSDPVASITIAVGAGATLDDGMPLVVGPGQSAMIGSDGTNYWVERGTGRVQLGANLTLYVATTGSDTANTGLTVGSPFLTIQKAWNVLQARYDLNGYTVTIQVADGTYVAGLSASGAIVGSAGPASVVVKGNTSTPTNCMISAATAFQAAAGASFNVQGFNTTGSGGGNHLYAQDGGSVITFQTVTFGTNTAGVHCFAINGGVIRASGNYAITGGTGYHWASQGGGTVDVENKTITLTGTPAFSVYFAQVRLLGTINCQGNTFSGSATGIRYIATGNGAIYTFGAGASYLPGNSAGSTSNGGQYF